MSVNCIFEKDNLCRHGHLLGAAFQLYCNESDPKETTKCDHRKKRPRKAKK